MNFKRKEGDPVLFGTFVKSVMGEMEKFMEPPAIDEELPEEEEAEPTEEEPQAIETM